MDQLSPAKVDWSLRSTPEGCEEIARRYYDWSQQLAELALRHLPVCCDPDALRSAAGLALLQAIRSYDPSRGIKFRTFATMRIRGAIVDAMRDEDKLSRAGRGIVKARLATEARLMRELGREPTQDEVCDALGWDARMYLRSLSGVDRSLDQPLGREEDSDHKAESLQMRIGTVDPTGDLDQTGAFDAMMKGFSMEERTVIYLYYYRSATMKAIATALGLSESRISQLHSAIIRRLKQKNPSTMSN